MAGQLQTRQDRLRKDEASDENLLQVIAAIGKPPRLRRDAKKVGKPYIFTDKHKEWVVNFLADMPSPQLAAKIMGLPTRSLFQQRNYDAAFRTAWDEAMDVGLDQMIGQAMEEAAGWGVREVMTPQGEVTTLKKGRNDKILLGILNFKMGQRHIHEGSITADDPPGTMVLKVTPEQLGKLTRDEQRELTVLLNRLESLAPRTINGSAQQQAAIEATISDE